jgi:hypothetical protein
MSETYTAKTFSELKVGDSVVIGPKNAAGEPAVAKIVEIKQQIVPPVRGKTMYQGAYVQRIAIAIDEKGDKRHIADQPIMRKD